MPATFDNEPRPAAAAAAAPPSPLATYLLLKRETRQHYTLLCLGLWSVISFLLISRFVFGVVEVQGRSMEATLHDGDRYMVNRLVYHWRVPERGELVVINDHIDGSLSVKRIVGLPGETFSIVGGRVWINGKALSEVYLQRGMWTGAQKFGQAPLKIPADHYMVLGDNRPNSLDSRTYGPLARKDVLGVLNH